MEKNVPHRQDRDASLLFWLPQPKETKIKSHNYELKRHTVW
jgi:hypothetical protein